MHRLSGCLGVILGWGKKRHAWVDSTKSRDGRYCGEEKQAGEDGPAKGTAQRAEEGCPRQTNHLGLAEREPWMPVELLNAEEWCWRRNGWEATIQQVPTCTRVHFTAKTSVHNLLDQEMRDRACVVYDFHVWRICSLSFICGTFSCETVFNCRNCLLLRQFLSLLPEDSVIFVATSFPCPGLTVIGRSNGMLGLVGDRSVLIHCGWAVLCYLSLTSSL